MNPVIKHILNNNIYQIIIMSTSASMTPLSKVMERLAEKGYEDELNIKKEGATIGASTTPIYQASDLTIVRSYRFEGESDPADMSILYAIETADGKKGFLLNAYGTYSDQDAEYYDSFILDVPIDEKAELEELGN
ncbi:hypothetical protein H8S90_06990 [Olivibacter sp. SDN3]|uniref:hypothetical protein n=1 Tax=Olivibacter sp. SDN3 TaxID=2764720 RepID=UPI0016512B25|nr:hypothetical protein [Olivibacter sp. SDN3]QNL51314.1 hypothetical protein H8S90_06990 [Olivibacter sp. SDN3]